MIFYLDHYDKTLTVVHDEGFLYPKAYHDRRTEILKQDGVYGKPCFDGSRCRPRVPSGPGGLIDMDLQSGYVDFCEFPAGVDVRVGTWRYGENGLQYSQTRKPLFRVPATEEEAENIFFQGPQSPSLNSLPIKDRLVLDTENEVNEFDIAHRIPTDLAP